MEIANATTQFQLEGECLGFLGKPGGKIKYVRMAIASGEILVKLAKELRKPVIFGIRPGDTIQVVGEQKFASDLGPMKLKAFQVKKVCPHSRMTAAELEKPLQPSAKLLVCQKSGCRKRGGKRWCQEIEAALCDRGLDRHVKIQETGCLKGCSSGPNLLLMPHKTRLNALHPQAIATQLEQYFNL